MVTERTSGLRQLVGAYHGWTYDLKGRLVAVSPLGRPQGCRSLLLRRREVDLRETRSGIWCGIVFINLLGPDTEGWGGETRMAGAMAASGRTTLHRSSGRRQAGIVSLWSNVKTFSTQYGDRIFHLGCHGPRVFEKYLC